MHWKRKYAQPGIFLQVLDYKRLLENQLKIISGKQQEA